MTSTSLLMYSGTAWTALAVVWFSKARRLSCWPVTAKDYLWPWLPPSILGVTWLLAPAEYRRAVELLASLGVVMWAFLTGVWLLSVLRKDSSIMDIAYAMCGVLAAWMQWWLLGADESPRTLLVLVVLNLWGWRHTLCVAARNLPLGEGACYARWRQRSGASWWWWSYFQVFPVQAVMIWIRFIPIGFALLVPGRIGVLELLALAVWLVGFAFEGGADWQLKRFKSDPANRGKVLNSGLWSQCHHSNYFGEATMWCAFGLFGFAHPWGWMGLPCTVYAVYMMSLGSATRMTDGYMKRRKPSYLAYAARTPSFVMHLFGGRPDATETSPSGEVR